jgi:hypothetical protein
MYFIWTIKCFEFEFEFKIGNHNLSFNSQSTCFPFKKMQLCLSIAQPAPNDYDDVS